MNYHHPLTIAQTIKKPQSDILKAQFQFEWDEIGTHLLHDKRVIYGTKMMTALKKIGVCLCGSVKKTSQLESSAYTQE